MSRVRCGLYKMTFLVYVAFSIMPFDLCRLLAILSLNIEQTQHGLPHERDGDVVRGASRSEPYVCIPFVQKRNGLLCLRSLLIMNISLLLMAFRRVLALLGG